MNMGLDIVGLGALNFDLLLKVDRLLTKEYECRVEKESCAPGGSAANTIYRLAKLGLRTGFVGAVGNDWEGKTIVASFNSVGVNTAGIKILLEDRTGLAVGIVDRYGRRVLYILPRANNNLSLAHIDMNYLQKVKILHLTSFADQKQLELQKKLLKKIPKTKISFGPGALYSKMGLKCLLPIIQRSEIIFLNQEELKALTKDKSYVEGAKKLIAHGCKIVSLTLGKKGCYVTSGKESYHVKAVKTKVLDLTGAGDAFAAGFLYGYVNGKNLMECSKIGNIVAAHCISKFGAREGLPTKNELERYV